MRLARGLEVGLTSEVGWSDGLMWICPDFVHFRSVTWLEVVGDGGEWFGGALAVAADLGHDLNVIRGWMEAGGQRPMIDKDLFYI